jgi:superfamily II DNA or RNA helicase
VQVASVQTLAKRARPPADLVFVDECHHADAKSWAELLGYYHERGATILGLTATPARPNGRGLADQFDVLHPIAKVSDLMAGGYLVEPEIYSVPAPDLRGVTVTGGDYSLEELGEVMGRGELVGGLVEHWGKLATGRTTVVFATTVEHSQSITAAFTAAGVKAEHLDGTMPSDVRDAVLGRLASGETQVVSNCAVLTEGWDLPRCKCVMLARPTKSLVLYLQMVGRGRRPWEGVPALLLDHAGCVKRHGLPQTDRAWTLEGRPPRAKAADGEEGDPTLKTCKCGRIVPRELPVCPACGYAWPAAELVTVPRETEENLVRVSAEAVAKAAVQELRRAINVEVVKIIATWEAVGWPASMAAPEVNMMLARRFKGKRATLPAEALERLLAFVRGPLPPEFRPPPNDRRMLLARVSADPVPAAVPATLPPPETKPVETKPEEEVVQWDL